MVALPGNNGCPVMTGCQETAVDSAGAGRVEESITATAGMRALVAAPTERGISGLPVKEGEAHRAPHIDPPLACLPAVRRYL